MANQTSSQFDFVKTATPVQLVFFIFSNNARIALLEFIPAIGAIFFLVVGYNTGVVTQVITVSQNLPSLTGVILFVFPYSFVELSAYAVAVGSGTMLVASMFRRRFLRELRVFAFEVVLALALLIAAAVMETATEYSLIAGLALWLPTGLSLAAFLLLRRRLAA